ncbi:hypothetical protein PGT21_034255 [Puccinia graminis f. sp. tritici]|uniref:Uncharacterized protein n=1 Tax=Puccinia graminis f. sp. tritici TaxID=56615 RepID=A0A5B0R2M9_PUCGR|nr:hypothetical protein PGT21_034255 [Puccinia graminis f. sp. tritici]
MSALASQSRKAQKTLHTTLPIGSKGHFLFSLALGHDWLSVSSSVLSGIQLIGLISGVGHLRANPAALKTVVKALANHRPFHPQSPSTSPVKLCHTLPQLSSFPIVFIFFYKFRLSSCSRKSSKSLLSEPATVQESLVYPISPLPVLLIPPRLSYCILNYKSITHPFVLNPSSRHSN